MTRRILAAAAAAALAALPARAVELNLKPGQWLVGIEIEVPGGRGPNPGKLENELCLTPDNAQQLIVPPRSPCRISDLRTSASAISWNVECSQGPMRTRGHGQLQLAGERYSGTVEMRADPPYEDMRIIQHLAGKRLGACKFPKKRAEPLQPYPGVD